MASLLPLVVLAVMAAVGTVGAAMRARRARDLPLVAARAGLQYDDGDPFGCTRVAFALFRKGDGRGAEHVMWRETNDNHVYRVFDYWYYEERRDEYGRTTRSYHRSSCALALVGSAWPDISIVREGLFDKVIDAVGDTDIDFESEEFNRMFAVRCSDRRFATALLDARMLELLVSTGGQLNFELKGRWLLVWTSPLKPALMPGLLAVAQRFVEGIPPVVWELYPSDFVDDERQPLPVGQVAAPLADPSAGGEDPWDTLVHSPFEALERHDGVEYDLDGHPLPKVEEDPWGDGRSAVHPN